MSTVVLRKTNRARRKIRIRKKILGTSECPRLSVARSNRYIYGQLIDDTTGKTLVALSLPEIKKAHEGKSKIEASFEVGKMLAEKAKDKKIKAVVFDRNGYKYHGRVKSVADGAREGGLSL